MKSTFRPRCCRHIISLPPSPLTSLVDDDWRHIRPLSNPNQHVLWSAALAATSQLCIWMTLHHVSIYWQNVENLAFSTNEPCQRHYSTYKLVFNTSESVQSVFDGNKAEFWMPVIQMWYCRSIAAIHQTCFNLRKSAFSCIIVFIIYFLSKQFFNMHFCKSLKELFEVYVPFLISHVCMFRLALKTTYWCIVHKVNTKQNISALIMIIIAIIITNLGKVHIFLCNCKTCYHVFLGVKSSPAVLIWSTIRWQPFFHNEK